MASHVIQLDKQPAAEGDEAPTETAIVFYRDAWGHKQEIRVTRATARGINAIRARYVRASKKWERGHVPFAVLANPVTERQPDPSEGESYARTRLRTDRADGHPWEGPRFSFDRLIGINAIWPLEDRADGKCPACLDAKLDLRQYCLHCDESGRDMAIGRPTAVDLRKRRLAKPRDPDGLAGGRGKAKAEPRPPTEKQQAKRREKVNKQAKARRKAARAAKYQERRANPKF